MKKLAFLASAAAFGLAACGSSTDASEEAVADTVEVPADEAMADVPEPVADPAMEDEMTEADAQAEMDTREELAEVAGDNAMDVVEAAQAAQAEMDAAEQ